MGTNGKEFEKVEKWAIWNGVPVTEQRWWELHLEQIVKEGVTREKLLELMKDLDMDIGDSLYVEEDDEELEW